jgi:hypothetical protein
MSSSLNRLIVMYYFRNIVKVLLLMPPKMEPVKELKIKKFDPSCIALDSTICLIGKRRVGKSAALRALLYNLRNVPRGLVMSGTEHVNRFFGDFIPETYIYPEYDTKLMEKIFKKQSQRIRKAGGVKSIDNTFFLVMDDLLSDSKNWKNDRQIRELLMNGRHVNILSFITMQYPLGIPPDLRTNLDYVFIFRETIRANRKRLWENFAGVIPKFDQFETLMDAITVDYNCLVINNNTSSNNLEDIVFYWKAPMDLPKFRVGCRNYWRFHDERFAAKAEDEDDDDALSEAAKILARYGEDMSMKVIVKDRSGSR